MMGSVVAYCGNGPDFGNQSAFWNESAKTGAVAAAHLEDADLQRVIASLPMPVLLVGRDMRWLFGNPAMAQIVGRPGTALLEQRLSDLLPEAGLLVDHAFRHFDAGNDCSVQHERNFHGRRYQLSASPLSGMGGRARVLVVTATDITRRWRTEQSLRRSRRRLVEFARQDHLTGLLNRRGWDTLLRREAFLAARDSSALSVLIADIDWFKSYNDTFGHVAGDQCLRSIAAELRRCVAAIGGHAGRFGGEEFVAILPGSGRSSALAVAERFRSAVAALGGDHRNNVVGRVSVSIGIASFDPVHQRPPGDRGDLAILKAADKALYLAKANGRDQIRYAPSDESNAEPG
jgi:diguanylate cyclase (GGDEF)-like protein